MGRSLEWHDIRCSEGTHAYVVPRKTSSLRCMHIMKKLQHEKLIQLYAVCTVDEPIYLVTELMKNWNLLEYLQRGEGRHLKLPKIIDIAAQVDDLYGVTQLHPSRSGGEKCVGQ